MTYVRWSTMWHIRDDGVTRCGRTIPPSARSRTQIEAVFICQHCRAAHSDSHDPLVDHTDCFICAEALRRAFNNLADLDLGPKDMETLIQRLRELAA